MSFGRTKIWWIWIDVWFKQSLVTNRIENMYIITSKLFFFHTCLVWTFLLLQILFYDAARRKREKSMRSYKICCKGENDNEGCSEQFEYVVHVWICACIELRTSAYSALWLFCNVNIWLGNLKMFDIHIHTHTHTHTNTLTPPPPPHPHTCV